MSGPFLRYTALRLALLVAVVAVLALAGARGVLLVVLAAVVSMALSYVLLRRQRDAVAIALDERIRARQAGTPPAGGAGLGHRFREGLAQDEAAEDAEIESSGGRPGRGTAPGTAPKAEPGTAPGGTRGPGDHGAS